MLQRKAFFMPSFEIYGSVAGFYDYGPNGCKVKQNVTQFWRQHFVLHENMQEVCSPAWTQSRLAPMACLSLMHGSDAWLLMKNASCRQVSITLQTLFAPANGCHETPLSSSCSTGCFNGCSSARKHLALCLVGPACWQMLFRSLMEQAVVYAWNKQSRRPLKLLNPLKSSPKAC